MYLTKKKNKYYFNQISQTFCNCKSSNDQQIRPIDHSCHDWPRQLLRPFPARHVASSGGFSVADCSRPDSLLPNRERSCPSDHRQCRHQWPSERADAASEPGRIDNASLLLCELSFLPHKDQKSRVSFHSKKLEQICSRRPTSTACCQSESSRVLHTTCFPVFSTAPLICL